MERNRRPPGVEEALSSMLWTPYERTPSVSSEDETPTSSTPLPSSMLFKPLPSGMAKFNVPPLYSSPYSDAATGPREKHLYPEPIRYSYPGYVPAFLPKSFNNSHSANQLPSYENIEKERQHHSLGAIGSTGIYFIPPFSGYGTSMVNSFTDDFLQYQVNCFIYSKFLYTYSSILIYIILINTYLGEYMHNVYRRYDQIL